MWLRAGVVYQRNIKSEFIYHFMLENRFLGPINKHKYVFD